MGPSNASGMAAEGDKIRVELYCTDHGCESVEELLLAVANCVRWKDRIELQIRYLTGTVKAPEYCVRIEAHSVVVCGPHVIHDADYHALSKALEDCEAMRGAG